MKLTPEHIEALQYLIHPRGGGLRGVVADAIRAALARDARPEPSRPVFAVDPDGSVRFRYRNRRGEVAERHVALLSRDGLVYGKSEWHPENQWILVAHDFDRDAVRFFALKDILAPE